MRIKWLFLGLALLLVGYVFILYAFFQHHAFAFDVFLKISILFLVILFLFFIALMHRHMFPTEPSEAEKLRADERKNGWVNFKTRD
ncbi:MAG: hypothetical protein H0W44_03865 [Gammaproteobacteria bacterium]|nr:hypothetical protein [Gammaproteobacteria bacterium]